MTAPLPPIVAIALALGLMVLNPPAALAQGAAAPAQAEEVVEAPVIDVVRLSANVIAPKSAHLSVAIGGLVREITVDVGDPVQEGDLLVVLDDAEEVHALAVAKASLAEAKARHADNQRRLRDARNLIKDGNIPKNQLDERETQVAVSTAALRRLEAEIARQEVRLARHRILAPFAGVIAMREAEAGEWVAPGSALVELIATEQLEIDVPVPQAYFGKLAKTAPVSVRFDGIPGETFATEPVALVPVSQQSSRTFTLRVRPIMRDIPITPGMSVQALIRLDEGENGLVVSRDAIIRYPDGRTTVWVVMEDAGQTTVAERVVTLGRLFDGRVHVVTGLQAGDRVVVRGNEALRNGQAIQLLQPSG